MRAAAENGRGKEAEGGQRGHRPGGFIPILAHVDLDAFFASVEQVLNPRLAGQPVVVGGYADDRSVVASASYEARARGIHVAMPLFRAYWLCPQAHYLRGNYHEYARFSEQVFTLCERFTPLVEPASVDEGYLDLTGTGRVHRGTDGPRWPVAVGQQLRETVKRETGLNVTVGIGSNKLVARIAGKYAKPNGLCYVAPGYEEAFLAQLPLKAIPGIGLRTAEVLGEYNLRTVADLRAIPRELLVRTFGEAAGESLYEKARGRGDTRIEPEVDPKSVSRETTFEQDTADLNFIKAMLYYLTERACRRLRQLGLAAHVVTVKVRYSDFVTQLRSRSLGHYSDQDHEFYAAAVELLESVRGGTPRRVKLRLVGVQLAGLRAGAVRQMHLWLEQAYEKRRRLYAAADRVRERFGFSSLSAGRSIELLATHDADREGFRLRTPCLSR